MNRSPRRLGWIFTAATLLVCHYAAAAHASTFASLAHQMIDLERLAILPAPGECGAAWTSTDRGARYDTKTGKYVNWGANSDGSGCIRMEGKEMVMAEMEGPGVLWRMWAAGANTANHFVGGQWREWTAPPGKGHVKIYLDGNTEPAVDMPFRDYFDGQHAPFNYPSLSYHAARGKNLYFPISYQKSCKVVADPGWGEYFQCSFATLAKDATVPTFSVQLAEANASALKEVDDYFRHRLGSDPAGPRPGEETLTRLVAVKPGESAEVARLDGPRAITSLRVRLPLKDREEQIGVLRKLALRITWDDQKTPAVWCPLGDFFGTAPGENNFQTLPSGMTTYGYYALWYMPFAKSAKVELVNDDETAREVEFEIVHAPLSRPFVQMGHFHAKWHRDVFPVLPDRRPDWTVLQTQGRGRYCGMMLHVWTPEASWWGEGDEKFFVNGEKYPSTFGTGSEDYFGFAYGTPLLFARPYHAQTVCTPSPFLKWPPGHVSLVRWQIVDSVPFQKSFEGTIEKYNDRPQYACTAYWYLSADGVDPHAAVPAAQRTVGLQSGYKL